MWGAIALGIGSGFRAELVPYLFLLWFVSALAGTRSYKYVLVGTAIILGVVFVWMGALAVAVGGVQPLVSLISDYIVEQARGESPIMGAELRGWLRQIGRVVVWNGLAAVWWIWTIPLFLFTKLRYSIDRRAVLFLALWTLPGLLQGTLVHLAAPGHTLFSIPAFCLLGARMLSLAARAFSPEEPIFTPIRECTFAVALIFNVMAFLNFFPLPDVTAAPSGASPSIKNAITFAVHETSLAMLRSMDRVAFSTLGELHDLTPPDRPSQIITTDVPTGQWILNWRILRYYCPERAIWVLRDHTEPRFALRIRRFLSLQSQIGKPTIPVPRGGRILWVLDHTGPFYKELASRHSPAAGQYVAYMDVAEDAEPFTIGGFEFLPQ